MNVKRILKYEVADRGPTMLPKGCELPDPSPARIVAVGIQLEPGPIVWQEKVVVWVEVTYPYANGGLPELELVPVNLRVVTTGTEVNCVGAEYVGTGQIQHDRVNHGAPLALHVYRWASVQITMNMDMRDHASPVFRGAGAAAAAAQRERQRS